MIVALIAAGAAAATVGLHLIFRRGNEVVREPSELELFLERIRLSFEPAILALGAAMLPAVRHVTEAFAELGRAFAQLGEALEDEL